MLRPAQPATLYLSPNAANAFVGQAKLEKGPAGHYWMRRRGMDHIWHLPHDEGACWAPREIRQGIMVTPYGYHAGRRHREEVRCRRS